MLEGTPIFPSIPLVLLRIGSCAFNLLDFCGDATLVIHNAAFDIGFLNAELERTRLPSLGNEVIELEINPDKVNPVTA